MNAYLKFKVWSFFVTGIICIFAGGYLYPYGPDKRPWAEFLLLIGIGQLLIFAVLFFLRYRKRNKEATGA